jgi:hypothetical protein
VHVPGVALSIERIWVVFDFVRPRGIALRARTTPAAVPRPPRLIAIIENLKERIREAKSNGWTGEVNGLTVTHAARVNKLVGLDRSHNRLPTGATRSRHHPGHPVTPRAMGVPINYPVKAHV